MGSHQPTSFPLWVFLVGELVAWILFVVFDRSGIFKTLDHRVLGALAAGLAGYVPTQIFTRRRRTERDDS